MTTIPEEMQAQFPDIKFNDSPRLANGERAMFVRILSKKDAKTSLDQVCQLNPHAPAHLDEMTRMTRVYAPDGDLVLSMMPTDHRNAHFICRMHKEVFSCD